MKFQGWTSSLALALFLPAMQAHAQAHSTATVVQDGPAINEAAVDQRNNVKASVSLTQTANAHAGSVSGGQPGILQVDSGRLTTIVNQQGDVSVLIAQRDTDLGWVTVTQTGAGHIATISQARNIDVTADIRQWNTGNRSTQIQTGLANGTADSWQSGNANTSMIEQSGSKVTIGFVIQEGNLGDASIVQHNVASTNAAIRQPGTHNIASIEQADGVNLNATVKQAGTNQFVSVEQSGANKTADISQAGALQRAAILQH